VQRNEELKTKTLNSKVRESKSDIWADLVLSMIKEENATV
jgi:hypothetical protein